MGGRISPPAPTRAGGFQPGARDQFVAAGQGMHPVTDPVRRRHGFGRDIENHLGSDMDRVVALGELRDDTTIEKSSKGSRS